MAHKQHTPDTGGGLRSTGNPELAHWMREHRKSSAVTPHTPKPCKGTRRG